MGDNNTQLPDEVVKEVASIAEAAYLQLDSIVSDIDCDFGLPMFEKRLGPIEEVLTEYAIKLHQAEQENIELKRRSNMAIQLLTTVSKQCTMRRALLIEIKTFLDGK